MKGLAKTLLATLLLATSQASADQVSAGAIIGTYLNPDRSRTVEVFQKDGRYFGVIATAPAEPDGNEGVGFVVFRDFVFNAATHTWDQGRLDSPMRPKINVPGQLSLNASGDLIVRGRGIAAVAGSSVFPRVE